MPIQIKANLLGNPLSAIVHCTDAITTAVEECRASVVDMPAACLEALNDNMQSAKIVLQCAHHQKRIIDDVLTLSKLDSMLLSITPVAVKPAKLIDSVLKIFEAELKSNRIHYEARADASMVDLAVERVFLDPSRITQIFINLLTNAIKFVKPSQDPSILIRFGACRAHPRDIFAANMFWATENDQNTAVTSGSDWGTGEELYLTFSVKDSGIGMKDKEITKIFERFRQANVKTHIKYGGSGLGLHISKQLTEKQGGEIGVSSAEGKGATFGFYIKSRRVERQPETMTELLKPNGSQADDYRQLCVLLVEDNVINQQVLSRQLKKAGCTVDIANHGVEALDLLEEKTYDVVLMDSEMPVMDGITATRLIREKERTGEGLLGHTMGASQGLQLPVIAVTANVRQSQVDTALAAGANRVMQKPFKAKDLVQMMKSLLPQIAPVALEPPALGLASRSKGLVP
jgi:signal transduction histidine kinase/AmiR/NasT family two-component response regulator